MSRKNDAGFSLVEVTLALGLVVFCLISLMALLPIGVKSDAASIQQTAAANMASALISDLLVFSPAKPTPQFGLVVPDHGGVSTTHTLFLREDGSRTGAVDVTSVPSDARYRVSVSFLPPVVGSRQSTSARIFIVWPAVAGAQVSGSFEVISALDRN